ncbi:hypothetical protein TEA_012981 [Camellia sinensis var. sinensis]|uniref:DUF3700 domain-containing protein n=1 Tax=Camellia sinensis var. sinensis TaxID=542762 RepID=A0A4S4F3C0_CAMSN|nr:hypothetical protein TEA_012981 [Camellia sinensis var. sinensis]
MHKIVRCAKQLDALDNASAQDSANAMKCENTQDGAREIQCTRKCEEGAQKKCDKMHLLCKLFCGFDDIYCIFLGSLNNLCSLIRQYGLSKGTDEALFVIEAYRTLRDRGPYPPDQVVKDLEGSFAFVVYDSKTGTVFTALGSDGGVKLYWGIAADGSVVISDDLEVIKAGCAKSFAPFPKGCMFHSGGGLMSFEHPMNKMKAMKRIDSEGVVCGASFKVDVFTRVNSIPRTGSEANWSEWEAH